MNAGPAGFAGAPVSKSLVLSVLGASVIVQASHAISSQHSKNTLATAGRLLVFKHPGILIFGTALLYYFRLFERQWGAVKYGSYCAIVLGTSYALEQAGVRFLRWPSLSGPYPLVFANFVPFFFDVPPTQRFSVFRINLSDKAFIYLAGVQMLVASSRQASLLGAVFGLVTGLAYRGNLGGLQRLLVPKAVCRFLGNTVGRLFGVGDQENVAPTLPRGSSPSASAVPSQANAPPLSEASPQALQQLVAMGFDQRRAAQALQMSHNDVQQALSQLL